ncbi:MAG TPA: FG-GAP-like repeat-containing protein [candidate division Zixibacteria bacterium]|nr:FG-GAP-like repeat-containing protein [candidate division Zixibacteria bacterium]
MDLKRFTILIIYLLVTVQLFMGAIHNQSLSNIDNTISTNAYEVNLKWSFQTENTIGTAPIPFDLEGDGIPEIIFGSQDGYLYCVDKEGIELWSYYTYEPFPSTPAVADLNNDGFPDIIFGSYNNNIYSITPKRNSTGIFVFTNWQYYTGGDITTAPTIIDIDNDNELEVLIGSGDSKLYCLQYDGTIEWIYDTDGLFYFQSALGVADINSDGKLEVLAGTDALYCINSTGGLLWKALQVSQVSYSSPTISDLDNDGELEIIIGSIDDNIYCLNSTGHTLWSYSTSDDIHTSSPAIYDIYGDSNKEIIIGSNDGTIYCLYYNGSLCWSFSTGVSIWSTPSIADLNNDGIFEILVGSNDKNFYCLQNTGAKIWNYTLLSAARTPSCIIDLDNDGISEIIFGSGYNDAKLYCLELVGVTQSGAAPWYCYRGSFSNTGWQDNDSDLLDDLSESFYGTNLNNYDTDFDSFSDGIEVLASTDPLNASDYPPRDETNLDNSTETNTYSFSINGFITVSSLISLFLISTITLLISKRKNRK